MHNTLDELEQSVLDWSEARGITVNGNASAQALKLMSEMGELADNLLKGQDVKDDIGDCLVVLINIAKLSGTTLLECGNTAYEDIKDRKGFLTPEGAFIKESDPAFKIHVPVIEEIKITPDPNLYNTTYKLAVTLSNQVVKYYTTTYSINPAMYIGGPLEDLEEMLDGAD